MGDIRRVLVVDDDAVARAVLRSALEAAPDMQLVGEARTAGEALALAHDVQPDVIVLDHHLPAEESGSSRMQGVEAVEYLRDLPSAPVIVVHSVTEGMAASAENAGADAFVTKSGDTSELLDAIRRLPPR
jgi:DNA-binding NarL/FixJ family response regulator